MINTPSPLRYPGGKTILYDKVKSIISDNNINDCTYIEPFSGGAGLALKLLFNNDVHNIIINDYDKAIYAFWYSVLFETDRFCRDIKTIIINIDEWNKQRDIYNNKDSYSLYEIGFATFFLNRTNRSGIIKGGPIGGYEQTGKYKLDCRFNKEKLINKIKKIGEYRDRIQLYNFDVNDLISKVILKQKNKNYFIYFDPPYINKGPELYKNHFNSDAHYKLSVNIKKLLFDKNWIITYDKDDLVYELYEDFKIVDFNLRYSAGDNKIGNEVMIYSEMLK